MIEIDRVSLRLGDRMVIEDVSIDVPTGAVVVLAGANGSGKSTLLRAASSELRPLRGEIRMAGRRLSDWSCAGAARVRAVLPQSSTLSFPFHALDVVLLGRIPHAGRVSKSVDRHVAQLALDAVDATHLTARLYPSLSGGERQRVQLARVLAQVWPTDQTTQRYLLLDEPTNNLDVRHQHLILRTARRAAAAGMGVLAVLHDLNLAAQYADVIVLLRQGQVIANGAPFEALTADSIHSAFGLQATVVDHPLHRGPLVLTPPMDGPSNTNHANKHGG